MKKEFTMRDFFEGLLWFVLIAQIMLFGWWGAECFDRSNPDHQLIAVIWAIISFILFVIGTIGGNDYAARVLGDCDEGDEEE